jgi:hypothetical protein
VPFYYGIRKHLSSIPWASLTWRPLLSTLVAGVLIWLLRDVSFLLLIPASLAVYVGCLIVTGTFGPEDIALMKQMLPARFRPKTPPAQSSP